MRRRTPPFRIRAVVSGDLVGVLDTLLYDRPEGGARVVFHWYVRVRNHILNALGYVAEPMFRMSTITSCVRVRRVYARTATASSRVIWRRGRRTRRRLIALAALNRPGRERHHRAASHDAQASLVAPGLGARARLALFADAVGLFALALHTGRLVVQVALGLGENTRLLNLAGELLEGDLERITVANLNFGHFWLRRSAGPSRDAYRLALSQPPLLSLLCIAHIVAVSPPGAVGGPHRRGNSRP